jgi:hypothetical protein
MVLRTCSTVNGLYGVTYSQRRGPEKMPLTSPPASPKLQSLTGFDGCDTVEADSPIKRILWSARGLVVERTVLIPSRSGPFLLRTIGS